MKMQNIGKLSSVMILSCSLLFGCNGNTASQSEDEINTIEITNENNTDNTVSNENAENTEISEPDQTIENTELSTSLNTVNAEVSTSLNTTSTEVSATEESEINENTVTFGYNYIDLSDITMISDYDNPDFSNTFNETYNAWKQEYDIQSDYTIYYAIDGYIIIKAFSGEFIGNTQTPYYLIEKEGECLTLDSNDIGYGQDAMLYIEGNVLYMYDFGTISGFKHVYLVEFSLMDGKKLNELYLTSGGDELEVITNTYSNISNSEQLEDYLHSISSTWYISKSIQP